ncbi:hypothetical protein [Actinoplanes sp. NPDC048796]
MAAPSNTVPGMSMPPDAAVWGEGTSTRMPGMAMVPPATQARNMTWSSAY